MKTRKQLEKLRSYPHNGCNVREDVSDLLIELIMQVQGLRKDLKRRHERNIHAQD